MGRKLLLVALLLLGTVPLAHARDIVAFHQTVRINSEDDVKDLVCAFCTIHIDGEVHGDLVTAFSNVQFERSAEIEGDAVSAFDEFRFKGDNRIHRDMVSFGSKVDAEGPYQVSGDRVSVPDFVAYLVLIAPFAILAGIVWFIVKLVQRRRRYAYPPPGYPGTYPPAL